jgi:hypothetical protein
MLSRLQRLIALRLILFGSFALIRKIKCVFYDLLRKRPNRFEPHLCQLIRSECRISAMLAGSRKGDSGLEYRGRSAAYPDYA